ncbi:MAG TPA: hypothetical protein VFX67_00185 [Burkholderiales bacterium]|nr:hypothetical protein [Burkholderiales bacterium]
MHTDRRIALWLAACLALGTAHAQPPVHVLERQEVAFDLSGTRKLQLSVVQLEGSGWTKERAIGAVREAAAILSQCDIALTRADWLRLAVPARYIDFFTPLSRELARLQPVDRPALYLVRETRNHPAFEAEAIGRGNSRSRPELADTVWMIAAVRDPGIALAHELAHVLMNSGEHSDEPGNLMREDTAPGQTRLSAAQCSRMRQMAEGNRLFLP